MHTLTLFSSNPLVQDLGWTLVHFLWQGAALAMLFLVACLVLRHRLAQARYAAGCVTLAAMVAVVILTFGIVHSPHRLNAIVPVASQIQLPDSRPDLPDRSKVPELSPAPAPAFASNTLPSRAHVSPGGEFYLPWVVAAWLAGVSALSMRLLAGWIRVRRLKQAGTSLLKSSWCNRLAELKNRMGLSQPVRLLQSAWVEVPTVIGWLRPVILMPASVLTGLNAAQLEALLAHELAHIRRYDYLVNLIQSVIEVLLFYHPAVWWVSRQVRFEREHCCDDVAVQVCGDRLSYARALTALEEMRAVSLPVAVGARGGSLLHRVQRLLGTSESMGDKSGWWLSGLSERTHVRCYGVQRKE